ncbi:MAG: phytanoyl-CoA dioxygenase family protein [Methylococcales bacterium]|nr:phytanoyl-CoA dioxygenase family protein [Methylococcales bacterium]
MNDNVEPYEDSMGFLSDPVALRARAEVDGYLFFRGLLPAEPLIELRREVLKILDRHEFLDRRAELMDGKMHMEKVAQSVPFEGCTEDVYKDVQRLESFHRLSHHPRLLRVYEALFNAPVLPHPRNIARVLFPGPQARATPPYQDFPHVQGSQKTWTAWFPLGDCPIKLGGLSLLKGSHRDGILDVKEAEGAGGLECIVRDRQLPWMQTDFKVGDVLTFLSTNVHQGLPNQAGNQARLSCDFRYQSIEEPIEEKSLRPHCQILEWEEIYQGWDETGLQYYWEKNPLEKSPWDESIRGFKPSAY